MVSHARAEYLLATEIHDVTSARIVGVTQMFPKLFCTQIAQYRDFPACIGAGDLCELIQRKTQDAYAGPASTGASEHLAFRICRLPKRPTGVGNGSGPATRSIRLPADLSLECGCHWQAPCALHKFGCTVHRGRDGLRRHSGMADGHQSPGADHASSDNTYNTCVVSALHRAEP